jgi:hypothetical protein
VTKRIGDWVQTYTGRRFWPFDPRPDDVDFRDVAHALANVCRFGGMCKTFYSVAQHSVLVASLGPQDRGGLWWLLHDAPEAYMGDITRPIKQHLFVSQTPGYMTPAGRPLPIAAAELRLMTCVAEALELPRDPDWAAIKEADDVVLATEARDLMPTPDPEVAKWYQRHEAKMLKTKIVPWSPTVAEQAFVLAYVELGGKL